MFLRASPGLGGVVLLALLAVNPASHSAERVPVLIDTDLGAGIGDAFALGLALGSEEITLRGVTAVGDPARERGLMLCRFLTMTGRRSTRVALGTTPQPDRPITDQSKYHYHPDPLFGRTTQPEQEPAAEFLHARLTPDKVTIVALGPLTNLAHLFENHPESAERIARVVLLEPNLSFDAPAARKVFASGVPLTVIGNEACRDLHLDDAALQRVFAPGTPLTRQVQCLYQMWDGDRPPLGEALAVALCWDERFAVLEERGLGIDDHGALSERQPSANVQFVTGVQSEEFVNWYAERMASLVAPERRPSRVLSDDRMPHRVHVAEDFETDIERFWWMSGKPETANLPPGSRRACRGVLTHNFDDLLMPSRQMFTAVIFNPVPGPPMGQNTRLRFRYWLKGTDTIRIQLYTLTNGYHRHLVVRDLPQGSWRLATVDMTEARRADGTGGPLAENERIDDIQFYVDPDAELLIDDIVLYDAGPDEEERPFPKRIVFAAPFDTGPKEQHWPGDYELVSEAGAFWRVARSVDHASTGQPWLRVHLRGERPLSERTHLSFRYRLTGADRLKVRLHNSANDAGQTQEAAGLRTEEWAQTTLEFPSPTPPAIDEVQFLLPPGAELLIDDLLLYEPE